MKTIKNCKCWTMIPTLNQGNVPYPFENFMNDDNMEYLQVDGKCNCGGKKKPPKR